MSIWTPLTREEELRLAHLVRQGDPAALEALVAANIRFVRGSGSRS